MAVIIYVGELSHKGKQVGKRILFVGENTSLEGVSREIVRILTNEMPWKKVPLCELSLEGVLIIPPSASDDLQQIEAATTNILNQVNNVLLCQN